MQRPVIIHDGVEYYLANSVHVEEVIINDTTLRVSREANIYTRHPEESGAMCGSGDIILDVDGQLHTIRDAKWAYVIPHYTNTKEVFGMNIPVSVVTLVIMSHR